MKKSDQLRKKSAAWLSMNGMTLLTILCVGTVIGSAAWTSQLQQEPPAPTPPSDQAQSAAKPMQQSLKEAATPLPQPSEIPWIPPLEDAAVQKPFTNARMEASALPGLWQVHDGVDFQTETGDMVRAMADGVVKDAYTDEISGGLVVITHGKYTVTYAGMSLISPLKPGDPVLSGQTIGYAGNGPAAERNQPPHLHLEVQSNGENIDPMTLLK